MTTPQIRIIDGDTVTDREMNAEELKIHNILNEATEQMIIRQKAQAVARASALAKLAALGLTDEEIAALVG